MVSWPTGSGKKGRIFISTIAFMIATAAGTAGATHVLPPLTELPPAGRAPGWQEFMLYREALRWFGGMVLALMVALVLSHFVFYGYRRVRPTGRTIRRYSLEEVLLHALLALSMVGAWASSTYLILAKYALGHAQQSVPVPLGGLSNTMHITTGLLFFGALVALAVIWRRSARFATYDADWLKASGGYFWRKHRSLPAGRFNAGQKIWFYLSLLLGFLVAVSGALLYYPGLFALRWEIFLYVVHTALAVALSATLIVHVYLAVLVHPQTLRAMVTGEIEEACVREEHPLEPLPGSPRRV